MSTLPIPIRRGRPSHYTVEGALAVARLVDAGHSLRQIVQVMPRSRSQLERWLADHEEFQVLLAAARLSHATGDLATRVGTMQERGIEVEPRLKDWCDLLCECSEELDDVIYAEEPEEIEAALAWCRENADMAVLMQALAMRFERRSRKILGPSEPPSPEDMEFLRLLGTSAKRKLEQSE